MHVLSRCYLNGYMELQITKVLPRVLPGRTRPKDNRLGVRILQAPSPHVSNVPCVCAMPALVIDCVYTIIFE